MSNAGKCKVDGRWVQVTCSSCGTLWSGPQYTAEVAFGDGHVYVCKSAKACARRRAKAAA